MHLLQFSLRFFCLIAYKEIILLRLRLFLATQDSCLAIFLSISSEESNERNDCSADCCAAAHVHWSVNNLNCAGLSVLDLYVVWEEHRGRCQINHTAEKKEKKKKRGSQKVGSKVKRKGFYCACSAKRDRRVNPSFLSRNCFGYSVTLKQIASAYSTVQFFWDKNTFWIQWEAKILKGAFQSHYFLFFWYHCFI